MADASEDGEATTAGRTAIEVTQRAGVRSCELVEGDKEAATIKPSVSYYDGAEERG